MPNLVPDPVWLYRMVHYDNLEFVLKNGMYASKHTATDPNYIFIGDSSLTQQRTSFEIPLSGSGNIGEYVAFYFCTLSPMLFNIKTGHRGITKRPQSDIIYICCKLTSFEREACEFVFCDGHAKNRITQFYSGTSDLDKIDWSLRWERYWRNTEEDYDRQRRKQAEFLVRNHVPATCIDHIVVYDREKATFVNDMLTRLALNIPVSVNPQGKFYY
jgi:hypothetical protein